ncbi:hypothetical protein NQT69_15110 [Pseudoalteromonas shioyasakiensis]|uniref:hypothetical protein n=1 Tax=Pseudoalteromonas shioyasakiensis TaxID=1190813 RepID=UPI00211792B1|nr:hypothetical protein [Pseudoalteromonas shioyasakiensis]MCQ8879336.1 hypothetical protein [Pseudoalteromonas shioyasakiensis]
MSKRVNYSRHIEAHWLDQTALWVAEGLNKQELHDKINSMLSPLINCKVNLGKTRNQLTSLWFDKNDNVSNEFSEFAVEYVKESHDIPLVIHWGLLIAKKKFFADVARFIGRNSKLNDSFTYAQVQKRMVELYGDTETVKRGLRSVLKTMVDFGVLQRSNARNYQVNQINLAVPNKLMNWLLCALLFSEDAMSRTLSDIIDDAIWFPFELSIEPEYIDKQWFEVHQQGYELMLFRKK